MHIRLNWMLFLIFILETCRQIWLLQCWLCGIVGMTALKLRMHGYLFIAQQVNLTQHSETWVDQLSSLGDLASNLILFSQENRI